MLPRSWEAALLVLDSRPFEDLHHIVEDFQDDRIWVFAEWVSAHPVRACMRALHALLQAVLAHLQLTRFPPSAVLMQVDKQFIPKEGVEWAPNYHGTLYNLTDDGVQVGWRAWSQSWSWRVLCGAGVC